MAASTDRFSPFDTRVGEFVTRSGVGIGSHRTIREAAELMAEESIGSLVVIESGEPIGILTKTDVVRRVIAAGVDPGGTVRQVMSRDLCVALPRVVHATEGRPPVAPTSHRALPTAKTPSHLHNRICETPH